MSTPVQVRRRLNGAAGSPPEAGMLEGEIAVNAQDGTDPELWFFAGNTTTGTAPANKGWLRLNPKAAAPTVGTANLPGGAAGSKAGIGTAWTALNPKPTDPIVIASFAGSAYVKTGAGGADADWTSLGSSVSFATIAEALAGTNGDKPIASDVLRALSLAAPSNTPANDVNHLVRLNAAGKIDAGFLNIPSGLTFKNAIDVTGAYAAPATAWKTGDFGVVQSSGTVGAGWPGIAAGTAATQGDMLLFDGTNYHMLPQESDLTGFVAKAGANAIANDMVMTWTAPAALTTVLDGADATKSQIENFNIENCRLDAGTY